MSELLPKSTERGVVTWRKILDEVEDSVGMAIGGWCDVDPFEVVGAFAISIRATHANDNIILHPTIGDDSPNPQGGDHVD